jgi:hypothetical protein
MAEASDKKAADKKAFDDFKQMIAEAKFSPNLGEARLSHKP